MTEPCLLGEGWDKDKNSCVQYVTEQEDIINIVRSTEIITVGNSEILFNDKIDFQNVKVQSSKPSFSCADDRETSFPSPLPQNECWKIPLTINKEQFNLDYKGTTKIDNYF